MADIVFDALTRWYGDTPQRRVLDDVSGQIRGGEFVVVVGRSGSGKSTLLNLLGGAGPAQPRHRAHRRRGHGHPQ